MLGGSPSPERWILHFWLILARPRRCSRGGRRPPGASLAWTRGRSAESPSPSPLPASPGSIFVFFFLSAPVGCDVGLKLTSGGGGFCQRGVFMPQKMGTLPKIMGSLTNFLRVMETPGTRMCLDVALVAHSVGQVAPTLGHIFNHGTGWNLILGMSMHFGADSVSCGEITLNTA